MKKANLLMAATVLASMTGSLAVNAAEATNKEPQKLDSTAKVTFTTGNTTEPGEPGEPGEPEEGGVVTPPGGGGETIVPEPGGVVPNEKAPLMLRLVPNFDFGSHKISIGAMSFPSESFIGSEEGTKFTSFIQVEDVRGGQKGWDLSLDTTPLENSNGDALQETSIAITDKKVISNVAGLEDFAPESNFGEIKFGEKNQPVMKADVKHGGGVWSLILGKDEIQTTDTNENVKLNISAKDSIQLEADTYTSVLTWNLKGDATKAAASTPA